MKQMKRGAAIAWLVAFILLLGILCYEAVVILNTDSFGKDQNIKLGLDLDGGVSITYEAEGDTPTEEEMADTITKLQKRIENDLGSSNTTEASVYKVGDDRITVEIPGVTDANALLEDLGTPGDLYFIAESGPNGEENYAYDSTSGGYVLSRELDDLIEDGSVVITGKDVKSANAANTTDKTTNATQSVVEINLNKSGTKAFATATTKAYEAGESIGIYYDGKFVSVPSVNAAITDGSCIIEGMEDYDAAESLASYIRIGGLNIKLKEIQSEVVGAQLGSNALATALKAGLVGLILVMIFVAVMYRLPGVMADLALVFYTASIIFILWAFEITLTLPGIAGIILSIGMAVDANVIIFSRIKEELALGHDVVQAVDTGFKKALSAILDGNITTLIAAAVLGVIGSGTVKGFAITLAIGVVLSMFTALVVTRILVNIAIAFGAKNPALYGVAKERKSLDFIGKKAIFFTASLVVIAAGFIAMIGFQVKSGKSLNYSLEFMGGTSTTVELDKQYTLDEVEKEIVPLFKQVTGDNDIQVQTVEGSKQIVVKTRSLKLAERQKINEILEAEKGIEEDAITSQSISSTISGEMRRDSLLAIVVAAAFMMIYIWFRFRDFRFASSAIIALIHDVLVVLTLYAIARISVGSAFIACMLTVIGYSVNDTIVVFDRIRENEKNMLIKSKEAYKKLCNDSITTTLSRSISTSITTALMVLMLLILGTSSIREFALPLLVGVLVGTYSSICLATELWYVMKVKINFKDDNDSKGQKVTKKAKKSGNGVDVREQIKKAKKEGNGAIV